MFNLLRLKPPHGWIAVAWELGIVTLGVLIALVLQQWSDQRGARQRSELALAGIRDELHFHYASSVEFRVVEPCIVAQIDNLSNRVLESGEKLVPSPLYEEGDDFHFVLRLPSKEYPRSSWDAANGEGLVAQLTPGFRNELSDHYEQVDLLNQMARNNDADHQGFTTMAKPISLDPSVRYALLHELQNLRGRVEFRDLLSKELIDHVTNVGMVPPIARARTVTMDAGTYRFCKAHGLPMRSFSDAAGTTSK